ncbi:NAD(P)H-dependent oxidoreductase [Patiriisocius marinus]|uniref:glutathione-regulated potassium-efflux system oxidoreductase KefF n=1 Tax=Patiriisocius marinus TaxID=1397112 RepID=UPI00232C8242|nr:NAD(P)H-dependent oxidoreductase [Patiriisocius marinus]
MKKVLILFAHPTFEKSRANLTLIKHIKDIAGVTFHDLYERYPDFHIDVEKEQELLNQHDVIVWHHPFYWYSCPPLMKQWIDMVLEFNWAYGPSGKALTSKACINVITTGGSKDLYCTEGTNSFTVNQFLRPFEQTANLCGMDYFPPYAVMGTYTLTDKQLTQHGKEYAKLIDLFQKDLKIAAAEGCFFSNNIPQLKQD